MVEVLVTLIILVVGLIGVFTLHSVAKRSNFEAYQYTQATYVANDLINRIRLNPIQAENYSGTYTGALTQPNVVCESTSAMVNCSRPQMRRWDLYTWERQMLGAGVTKGKTDVGGLTSPTVCVRALATGDVTVVVTWQGMSESNDAAASSADSLVSGCGAAGKMRRHIVLSTVVI
ncbi:type IV pilus modification protein PilV [Paraferrimonas haliotis]|uniref:Type IV pilus modification protein PilV n=1 Tax=Paraferrimonas haliotis TaxID=2013866 RepID=A0AA37TLF0_9GAMM|nr:type IV pilus modification protein PilV [Paraferrimonas haliotis]